MAAPLILSVFPSFALGGAQQRFIRLATSFGGDFRHAIIALDGRREAAARLPAGLDVRFPEVVARKGATLASALAYHRALRQLRPDLLLTANWGSIEWAMANLPLGLPHLHTEDGFGPEEQAGQLRRRVLLRRALLRRATVVLPSRNLLCIAETMWRLPARGLRYLPNGVDLARFRPAARSAERPGPGGANAPAEASGAAAPRAFSAGSGPVIGTVAALRPEKNLARLLEAVARLPVARLAIVGDGPERGRLEALAAQPGLAGRVHFHGAIADPAPLYAGFDIFALSSDTEQMPLAVLEAMAAGLPVVATDVGDVRDMLGAAGAGFVVPPEANALADALAALLADPARRAALGAANRQRAEAAYDERAMLRDWRQLLDAGSAGAGRRG